MGTSYVPISIFLKKLINFKMNEKKVTILLIIIGIILAIIGFRLFLWDLFKVVFF